MVMWIIGGLTAGFVLVISWLWQRVSHLQARIHEMEVARAALGDRFVNHEKCGSSRSDCQTDLKADLAVMAATMRQQAEQQKILSENVAALTATVNAWIEAQRATGRAGGIACTT